MVHIKQKRTIVRYRSLMLLIVFALVLPMMAVAQSAEGGPNQTERLAVTDQELDQFVAALENVHEIQQQMVTDTEASVADSTFEETRFQELLQARQAGTEPETPATGAEQEEFDRLVQEIQTIQQESNQQMVRAVQEEDLNVQRYNQIAQAVQQNPSLMERLQSIRAEGDS